MSDSGIAGIAGIFDRFFNSFTGFTSAFLNSAQQFLLLAFDELKIVVGELSPFLFQFAFRDVPVAFDFESIHNGVGVDGF